ncbi:MAG: hypothetical protein LBB39_01835, partial [Mycoplasmataceae bacterium]|nr:hypothetical protein [Mycoplasmataceae bacterium]
AGVATTVIIVKSVSALETPVDLSTIFGTSALAWTTGTDPLSVSPQAHQNTVTAYLNSWLENNSHSADKPVLNDLAYTFNGTYESEAYTNTENKDGTKQNTITVTPKTGTTSYTGSFTITYYLKVTGSLQEAVSNVYADFTTLESTTAGDVIKKLGTSNTALDMDAVEIEGYTTNTSQITKASLLVQSPSTWKQYNTSSNLWGYELKLKGKTGGWYNDQEVSVYIKFKRPELSSIFPNTVIAETFNFTPTQRQLHDRFISEKVNHLGSDDKTNFQKSTYTTELDGGLKITYPDDNEYFNSGTITFTSTVLVASYLETVFNNLSTCGTFYKNPTVSEQGRSDVFWNIKALNGTIYDNVDFSQLTISAVDTSNHTVTISPRPGSLWYSGSKTISYQLYT